jgi:hypothetical protein
VATLAFDVLEVWREAERLLERIPPTAPDHEAVELAAADLRATYLVLTNESTPLTASAIAACRDTIAWARDVLRVADDNIARDLTKQPVSGAVGTG